MRTGLSMRGQNAARLTLPRSKRTKIAFLLSERRFGKPSASRKTGQLICPKVARVEGRN